MSQVTPPSKNARTFIVKGKLILENIEESSSESGLELLQQAPAIEQPYLGLRVELWSKGILDTFYLGYTDSVEKEGDFTITFSVSDMDDFVKAANIEGVFVKVYYKGVLIIGANPYVQNDKCENEDVRPFKDLILKEGFNDLGDLHIDVLKFEFPKNSTDLIYQTPPKESHSLRFKFDYSLTPAFPIDLVYLNIECFLPVYEDNELMQADPITLKLFEQKLELINSEYFEFSLPPLPFLSLNGDSTDAVLKLRVEGDVPEQSKQCYIEVTDGTNTYYALTTDIVIHNETPAIYVGNNVYYYLTFGQASSSQLQQVGDPEEPEQNYTYIDEKGAVYTYITEIKQWANYIRFSFVQFEFPEELDEIDNGIYAETASSGTKTVGYLGDEGTSFEAFKLRVLNRSIAPISVKIEVERVSDTNVIDTFIEHDLLPGSKDFTFLTPEVNPFPRITDDSPTLEEIETVSGITFTQPFKSYLESEGLTTLDKLRAAGPINYLIDLPVAVLAP